MRDEPAGPLGIGHHGQVVIDFTAAGIGLDYDVLRLDRMTTDQVAAGSRLRDEVAGLLASGVEGVEQIGSSSVTGLLAKPIIDLAVGIATRVQVATVRSLLEDASWIYRGDAGDSGGHVFVLETLPWHRVAHVHVVEFAGEQWGNYLRFRDLLRRSPQARERYGNAKARLSETHMHDRRAYTDGKTIIVHDLLADFS